MMYLGYSVCESFYCKNDCISIFPEHLLQDDSFDFFFFCRTDSGIKKIKLCPLTYQTFNTVEES